MAEEKIEISIEFDGAREASRELEQVAEGVDNIGDSARTSGRNFAQLAGQGQQLAQRIQSVASASQQLVSMMGSENSTAGMVASVAGATAQFAAMGSMLGPQGTVIGGLVGLVAGLASAAQEFDNASSAASRYAEMLGRVRESQRNADLERRRSEIASGTVPEGLSDEELEVERRLRLETLNDMRRRLEEGPGLLEMITGGEDPETTRAAIRQLEFELGRLNERQDAIRASAAAALAEGTTPAAAADVATPRRGGGGGGRRAAVADEAPPFDFDAWMESTFAATDAERDAWSSTLDDIDGLFADSMEERERLREEEQERIKQYAEEQIEIAHQRKEREEEIALEQQEQQAEMAERGRESISRQLMEVTDLANQTMMTLGKTIVQVIKGEQSAEQAFTGFLKSFLEMMSQYAGLKAAAEFAEAIGAFATQNYAGGGQHIAAGAAWTAVAIATGVGAAAINTAPSAPARPEGQSMGGTEGKGGEVVINWNSPVVTAGTYADLGRELQTAVEAAGSI